MWYLSSVMPFYYLGCMLKLIALHSYTMLETKVQFPIEGEKFFGLPIVTNSTHARVMDKKSDGIHPEQTLAEVYNQGASGPT